MSGHVIGGVALDHVAHAVPRWQDVWNRYAVDLGAVWNSGGPGPGFAPGQLRFANRARIEVLMPYDPDVNDFLQRFLATNGPGPHHLTFKVPDLSEAVEQARAAGFEPIGINRTDPEWMEAFLHPKVATGVVVQIAEAPNAWTSPPPADYPTERRQRQDGSGPVPSASFRRVVHAVAELEQGVALFVSLLGANVIAEGTRPDHRWMELGWGGPLALRLVSPTRSPSSTSLRRWLGDRTGRIHHIEFTVDEPAAVPDTVPGNLGTVGLDLEPATGPFWVIGAEDNAGLRLVLRAD